MQTVSEKPEAIHFILEEPNSVFLRGKLCNNKQQ